MDRNLNSTEAIPVYKYVKGEWVMFCGSDSWTNNGKFFKYLPPSKALIVDIVPNEECPYKIKFENDETQVYVNEEFLSPIDTGLRQVSNNNLYLGMKYYNGKIPLNCILRDSSCYKKNKESFIKPVGIVWNSTGVDDKYLKTYVQPLKENNFIYSGMTYSDIIQEIGFNSKGNDYNHTLRNDGYHIWIGENSKNEIISIQTLPFDIRAAGCGEGTLGSADNGWLQINICESALNDKTYFYKMYSELIHITAYLCELFDINPTGQVMYKDILGNEIKSVPTIMDHAEAYEEGLATPRTDVFHWFKRYDKNMRKAREDVLNLIFNTIDTKENLAPIPETILNLGNQDLTYKVKVNVNKLNVRSGPGLDYEILSIVTKDTILEIKEENGWGKIVNEEGWIDLEFTTKLEEESLE